MDNPVISNRTDVVTASTAPRPTPPPARVPFAQVLSASAQGIVRGADQAASALPGAPLVAVALRGASTPTTPLSSTFPINGAAPITSIPGAGGGASTGSASAEGPTTSSGASSNGLSSIATAAGGAGDPSVDGALAQSQEMNLYFLQIQEEVNAQDRAYSAYSNVLKSQHDTVMTAVGNIR